MMNKAAFFDRDGTINVDTGYLYEPARLVFIPGIPQLIYRLNQTGYLVIVITNQSGIARGMYTEMDMHRFHGAMNDRLKKEYGTHIDDFYYCPHLPEITGVCECRKPNEGMFLRAIHDYEIDPNHSISFGDSKRDEEASKKAGIPRFFYVTRDGVKFGCL